MEDEDEFGDLYTDVLLPFSTSIPSSTLAPSHLLDSSFNRTSKSAVNDSLLKDSATNNNAVTTEKSQNRFKDENPEGELQFDIDSETAPIPEFGTEPATAWENSTAENGEDEEESESDDDLQIVLNDTRAGAGDGEEDDEEDGDGLIIVADGDPNKPAIEESNWGSGEDGAAPGERREVSEKGGVPVTANSGQKIGFSNYNYHHPFHSQFKYVRPGAAPLPGSTNGTANAAPQVRPQMGMNVAGGRGRGVIKAPPTPQKGYFSPFPGTPWTGAGRGLDFTLPSHKTIVDVDIDSFEEKPWRHPGIDVSDFFNFEMNEESWKDYCKQLGFHRIETTMQSKIRVYEVGRGEQYYDPDMPPELVAASGVHDSAFENSSAAKSGATSVQGSLRLRQLPTGRAIQVETGQGDRLPSVDTRPPRIRDCDAIIEIICQGSLDSESSEGNNASEEAEERTSSAVEVDLSKSEASNNDRNGAKSSVEDGSLPNAIREGDESKNEAAVIVAKRNTDNSGSKPARSSEESKPRSGTSAEEECRESGKSDHKRIFKGSEVNHRTSRKDDHLKQDGHDRRREVEQPDSTWERRHDDGLRKNRNEDSRIRDRNGSYRDRYEIDKRKKEEEHSRREEPRDRRRREWEDGGDSRKRNDNALQMRHKEKEGDRRDRDRSRNREKEREEITRARNSNDENVIRRERETVKNSSEREHRKRHRIEDHSRRIYDNKLNKFNSRPSEATENQKQRKRDDSDPSSLKKKEGERTALPKKQKEEASSDEDDENSKRGRSKLERWNSHKEDYGTKINDTERMVEGPLKQESVSVGVSGEAKENEAKQVEDQSLDPVEKMKKRSERFKLPMPGDKDTATRPEKHVSDVEVKLERPARKRRWISN